MRIEKFSKKSNNDILYSNGKYILENAGSDIILKKESNLVEITINDLLEIARHYLYIDINKNYEVCDLIDLSIRKLNNIQKR